MAVVAGLFRIKTFSFLRRTMERMAILGNKRDNRHMHRGILIALLLAIAGCSQVGSHLGLINRLNGRGAVLVSPDNPYLAANMLLTEEMEKSKELKGFIDLKGLPDALEVKSDFFEPVKIKLYYGGTRQIYTLEQAGEIWLIQGPSPITELALKEIGITIPFSSEIPRKPEAVSTVATPAPTKIPIIEKKEEVKPIPTTSEEINLSKLPMAETSPRGDLVHYVVFQGETLNIISKWYTGDERNSERLSRLNGFKDEQILQAGDEVVIPGYLVKNQRRYNETILKSLIRK